MHVDHALRRPHPVVLFRLAGLPLDAAEVDAPFRPGLRLPYLWLSQPERRPGISNLESPTLVLIAGVVQGALHSDRRLQAFNVPTVVCFSASAVRLVQEQIPTGIQRVHLELVITVRLRKRFEEHFKIVVVKDYRIVFRELCRDIRLFELRRDVEVLVVPQHLYARAEAWFRHDRTLNVNEVRRPRDVLPGGVVQFAVNRNRVGCARHPVGVWHGQFLRVAGRNRWSQ